MSRKEHGGHPCERCIFHSANSVMKPGRTIVRVYRPAVFGMPVFFLALLCSGVAGAQSPPSPRDLGRVDSLMRVSWALQDMDPGKALQVGREAVELAQRIGDEKGESRTLQCMAGAHRNLGRPDSAIADLLEALRISERLAYPPGELSCAQKLAQVHTDKGEVKEALAYLDRAERIAQQLGNEEEQARTLNLKGAALETAGRYEEAVAPYFASIDIRKRLGSKSLSMSYQNLGSLYLNMGRAQEATLLYAGMVEEARSRKDAALLADGYLCLSAVETKWGHYDRALAYTDSALTTYRAIGKVPRIADALLNRAAALMELGRYEGSRTDLDSAMAVYKTLDDQEGMASVCINVADLDMRQEQAATALTWCERGLALANANGLGALRAKLLSKKADALRALGKYDEAVNVLHEYLALKDSILGEAATKQLASAEMHEKYDAVERIARIEQLKAAKDQEQALRIRRTTERNGFLAAAAALLLLSLLLYRNVQHRRKLAEQEEQIHEKKVNALMHDNEVKVLNALLQGQDTERNRIAKDLHDRLGSMLSAIKHQFGALENRMNAMHAEQTVQYNKVYALLDDAVEEVRRVSHDMLKGALVEFDLGLALRDLRDSIALKGQLDVELNLFGMAQGMERSTEIAVYRIVQELVSNSLKHARPTEMSIALTQGPERLSIIVSDNGIGFDPSIRKDGIGMDNIRQRAEDLGGSIHVDSREGHGTSVSIEIPLAPHGQTAS